MEEFKLIVAKNISDLRKESGMTQLHLAEALNYSDKAVSKWERGESLPDVGVLKSIAELFGVTVDYLLTSDHSEYIAKKHESTRRQNRNRFIVTALSTMLVWLIATVAFVNVNLILPELKFSWLIFIYAFVVSLIVILVFNSLWGNLRHNFIIVSLLVWGALVAAYLTAYNYNIWLIFIIGIPAQVIIFLWSKYKRSSK